MELATPGQHPTTCRTVEQLQLPNLQLQNSDVSKKPLSRLALDTSRGRTRNPQRTFQSIGLVSKNTGAFCTLPSHMLCLPVCMACLRALHCLLACVLWLPTHVAYLHATPALGYLGLPGDQHVTLSLPPAPGTLGAENRRPYVCHTHYHGASFLPLCCVRPLDASPTRSVARVFLGSGDSKEDYQRYLGVDHDAAEAAEAHH